MQTGTLDAATRNRAERLYEARERDQITRRRPNVTETEIETIGSIIRIEEETVNLKSTVQEFSIRFHFKSGQYRDMWVDSHDADDNYNDLECVRKVMISVDNMLKKFGNYAVKNFEEITQNFIIYEGQIEFMEIVPRNN